MTKQCSEIRTLWVTPLVTVVPEPVDHDLHAFHVYRNGDARFLGSIRPDDLDIQDRIIGELNDGCCPIADHWEDGAGNTCTIEGWRGAEVSFATDLEEDIVLEMAKPDPVADVFFIEDHRLMHDMLSPAYENMNDDLVDTDDDGFLREETLDYFLKESQDPDKSNVGHRGHARCLIPFLGWCNVNVLKDLTMNEATTRRVRDLVDRLKDDTLTRSERQLHSGKLTSLLNDVLYPNEHHIEGPPRKSIVIKPSTEKPANYVVDYNDGDRYAIVGVLHEAVCFAESRMRHTHKDIDVYKDDVLVAKARWHEVKPDGTQEDDILFRSIGDGVYTEWELK